MTVCYLGLGANLGNRRRNISSALKEIGRLRGTQIIKLSQIIETTAVGGPRGQGKFLNAALKIKTRLSPFSLFKSLKAIEKKLGRPKRYIRYGPRIIDIDILFYEDREINTKMLKIPHPKVFMRDFVMRPLLEVL